jgi:sodium/proline symporter
MPHILVRFMAVKNQKELNKSKGIAIIWVAISLAFAVVIGVLGRAFLYPTILGVDGSSTEIVFIEMIKQVFTVDIRLPIVAGLFLCGILAAIMSTADSQLLVTASSVSEDIYKGIVKKNASQDNVMKVSKITVVAVAVLAYLIAWDPNSSIMGLVSNAWAGLGAAFGPTVLMSLFWKRCNLPGAVAGILSGGLTVIIWDYIPLAAGQTLGAVTGLYSLAIGFLISIVLIVVVSLCTKEPEASIVAEFERVASDEEI